MNKRPVSALTQGNKALREKHYEHAIQYYLDALANSPELAKIITQNIVSAKQKYKSQRAIEKNQRVAVCGWELAHNAAGRVYTLAQLYDTFAEVEIIGTLFPKYGRQVWEPIRNTKLPIHSIVVEDESVFLQHALKLVATHPYDIVHLSKPRISNIFIGLLYKLIWGAKVLIDIDDEELAFVSAENPLSLTEYLKAHTTLPELKDLDGLEWTRLAVGLVNDFDGITVSNPALQQRYGGDIIRHVRNEQLYQPTPELKRKSREKFGIPKDKKVVLFCGTPRAHKGLIETANAIAELKRDDVVFAIVGDFPEPQLKATLQAIEGVDYRFIANQPFDSITEVVAMGDICILLQDPQSPVSHYQVPAKLSDALGMGLMVLAYDSPAFTEMFQQGAVLKVNQETLNTSLQTLLSDGAYQQQTTDRARQFFNAELSYSANKDCLQQLSGNQQDQQQPVNNAMLLQLFDRYPAVQALRYLIDKNAPITGLSRPHTTLNTRLKGLNNSLIDWRELAVAQRQSGLVSIIIPVYNQPELTQKCIAALYAHTPIERCEIIIVDNGSDKATQNVLAKIQKNAKNLSVLRQNENLNFALGSNLGFAASHGETVLFLNNDTEVTAGWLDPLIKPLENADIVAVQPQLLYPDGTIQCVGVVFSEKSALGYPIYAGMKPENGLAAESRKYQAVTGACMALRAADFISIKGFDPIYINGQEDIDLCLRLTLESKRSCWYVAESVVVHHESKSVGRFQYIESNRAIFVSRWKDKVPDTAKDYYKEDGYGIKLWKSDRLPENNKQLSVFIPKLEKIDKNKRVQLENGRRIAVCVHVFYEHLWETIDRYLKNINDKYDLYVSCPEAKYSQVSQMVLSNYPNAYIIGVENLGMDVLPFLFVNREYKLWSYDAVLKLHTKNDKTRDREILGRMLFDGVLGSSELCKEIIYKLTNENELGLIGAECLCRSSNYIMYGNRDLVYKLLDICAIPVQDGMDWGFVAGTMFWVKGDLLKPLDKLYDQIYKLFIEIEDVNTGGDGTYAHAMERFFGALPYSKGYSMGLSYRCDIEGKKFKVRTLENQDLSSIPLYRIGSAYFIERYVHAHDWGKVLKNDLFDEEYYCSQAKGILPTDMDPRLHYILYGDIFLLSPSKNFSTQYYLLKNKDIVRARMSPFVHYLVKGQHEGRVASPSIDDWLNLAIHEGIFDVDYYKENFSLENISGQDIFELYKKFGYILYKSTSKNFLPSTIPALNYDYNKKDYLVVNYLKENILIEYEYYDLLERCYENKDFSLALKVVNTMIDKFGMTKALMEVLGAIQLLSYEWALASDTWNIYWNDVVNDTFITRCKKSILKVDRPVFENKDFDILDKKNGYNNLLLKKNKRICIYTTLFGSIDDLLPVVGLVEGVDFICFSDRPRNNCGWEVRVVNPGMLSPNMNAKIFKILPHKFLDEYDFSLFVDANTLLLGRINALLSICLQSGVFIMWRHPLRRDVYLEAVAIITAKRHEPKKLIEQLKVYSDNGLPHDTGLVEGSFIWREHGNPSVKVFMEEWWQEIQKFSYRDQISLGYLMWKRKVKPLIFPENMGTSRKNEFFIKIPHKKNEYIEGYDKNLKSTSYQSKNTMDIVFLYADEFLNSGSTIMRGEQLCRLVSDNLHDSRKVIYSSSKDIHDSIVFMTKGFLKIATPDILRSLKLKGNILLADFVDEPPNEVLIEDIDALVASSIAAYKYYKIKWPNKESFHVTHHVDPRIAPIFNNYRNKTSRDDLLKFGYFGELVNSKISDKIQGYVDFISVDTSKVSTDWMLQLPHYNFHYAVRQRRGIDGYKPFLKGFVAAYCDSNIIIQESEGDAMFYLGSDYPFSISQSAEEAEIIEMLEYVKDAYRGPEWQYGLDIMREIKQRSSNDFVLREFMQMIDSI